MSFFVVQVLTGTEAKFLRRARQCLPEDTKIWWPRRALRIRHRGSWRNSDASIFPGYLFLEADGIPPEVFGPLKRIPEFLRFLRSNRDIEPLGPRDQELLMHFISHGEVVHRSTVTFDSDNRIRVIAGPLKGLEGRIVKVNRRKGRARVKLEMYENSFVIDFGFESIENAPAPAQG